MFPASKVLYLRLFRQNPLFSRERAGRLFPRDLKISPRSTRLDIPSSCPHAWLLWRVLPVAGAGSWGRLLVQHSSSRAAIEAPAVELWFWLT